MVGGAHGRSAEANVTARVVDLVIRAVSCTTGEAVSARRLIQ